jgi:uncharacterized membrane protein YjjP (DUF1212 family)
MQASKRLTNEMAEVLLKISSLLMTSGANTNRILLILDQFSMLMHADAQVFINHKAFIISLTDMDTGDKTTQVKRLPANVVNFTTISELSEAAVRAEKEDWSFEQIRAEVDRIDKLKHHPRLITLTLVSLAGGGLCILFGGDYLSFAVVFVATFLGLFVRQTFVHRAFNAYLAAFFGALVAGLIAASILHFIPNIDPNIAIATSVLFLVPGVPLINSFTDFIDGYILTGFVRLMNGLLFVFSIAFALFIVMYLFHIQTL